MFPHVIEHDGTFDDRDALVAWASEQAPVLKDALASAGALLFRGFPVRSAEDFDAFTAAFGYRDFTYAESLSNAVRINKTPRVFTANEAPPETEIFLHHEMAQTPISPEKLFFCCLSAAESGGATPLCRSDQLYATFKAEHPDQAKQFEDKGLKYTTWMPATDDRQSGQGRSWRSTLSVETVPEAEAKLSELGYTWEWQPDESLSTTTPVLPAVITLPDGKQSFFNQVIAAWCGWKRGASPPVTFGNGEPIAEDVLDTLVEISQRFTVPAEWQDGDVALVDNPRVLHGRYPYSGDRKREVVVCLARDAE